MTVFWLIIALIVVTPIVAKIFAPLARFFVWGIILIIGACLLNGFANWWDNHTLLILGVLVVVVIVCGLLDSFDNPIKRFADKHFKH